MSDQPCRCSAAGRVPAKHVTSLLPSLSGKSTQLTLTVWLPCRHHNPPPRRLRRSHIGTHTHTCKAGIWQRPVRHGRKVGDAARVSSTPQKVGCKLLSDSDGPHSLLHARSHMQCCKRAGLSWPRKQTPWPLSLGNLAMLLDITAELSILMPELSLGAALAMAHFHFGWLSLKMQSFPKSC